MATTWGEAQLSQSTLLSNTSVVVCMFLTDKHILVSLDGDGIIKIFERHSDKQTVLRGHTGAVWDIKVVDNNVVSGGTDTSIKVWDTESG